MDDYNREAPGFHLMAFAKMETTSLNLQRLEIRVSLGTNTTSSLVSIAVGRH